MKKLFYRLISYLFILAIFFFLGKVLIENWSKIQEYQFSFNYGYLVLAFICMFLTVFIQGLTWGEIVLILDKEKKVSRLKLLKSFIYSWFGRYLPGKAWMYLGRMYLSAKEEVSKKALALSMAYEVILTVAAAFLFAAILLAGSMFGGLYFIPVIIIGLLLIHPKILNRLYYFLPKKLQTIELSDADFLGYGAIIRIVFYYFLSYFFAGLGFFFLIRSIAFLPLSGIVEIIGSYILASILGVIAIFAPSGLGVREGFLVFLLKPYFPVSIAVLISLLSRLWTTIGEILILFGFFLFSKIKKL